MLKQFKYVLIVIILMLIGCIDEPFALTTEKGRSTSNSLVRLVPPPGWRGSLSDLAGATGRPFRALMQSPDQWIEARANVDYLGYYSAILNDNFNDVELRGFFSLINSWDLDLSLEVTTVKYFNPPAYLRNGRECYLVESERWARYEFCGADIGELTMDEPLTSSLAGGEDLAYAVDQTADWIELTRNYFNSSFGKPSLSLIEAYPHNSAEEILEFISLLQKECASRSIEGINSFTLDFNCCTVYNTPEYWAGVSNLRNGCSEMGIPFCIIFWSPNATSSGSTDEDFYSDVLDFGQYYYYLYNINDPEIVSFQSWTYVPRQIVPEDEYYSFTKSFNIFHQRWLE